MSYLVEISQQADADLRGILDHIARNLMAPDAAIAQLDRLEEQIEGLDALPNRFQGYQKEPWRSRNLRIMPVDNYCIFYTVDDIAQMVTVLRVLYGGRDVESQLRKLTE